MKILLIAPSSSYSISGLLVNSFSGMGHEVVICDPEKQETSWRQKVNTQAFRLPHRYRKKWDDYFLGNLNDKFINVFNEEKPDMVLVYNDSMLLPETVQYFKKTARTVFYLGDNPYYTWTKPLFLNLLMEADYIFAPDTMWVEQLKMLGLKHIYFEIIGGWDKRFYFPMEPSPQDREKYSSDLLFIGNSYVLNWGFKRTLFTNQFADLDIKIYGTKQWLRWLTYFPDLQKRFILQENPIGLEQVNLMSNCCKLYPVDANPGLLHGLHARIFDCIGSGILPLVEYRKDLDDVFKNTGIPKIYNYNDANSLAKHFLNNEKERLELIEHLRKYVAQHYLPNHGIERMFERMGVAN